MKLGDIGFGSILDRSFVRQCVVGSLFWLAFLLMLEPGNIVRAAAAQTEVAMAQEVIRIALASLLAGATAPLQFRLVRDFPVERERLLKNASIHLLASASLALCLIVIAFSLAPLVLATDNPRLRLTLGDQIASNAPLLTFAMVTMAVLLHSFSAKRQEKIDGYAAERWLTRLQAPSRAGMAIVAAQDIDWIEAQGNYVALHVGADTYLVRQTMSRLADALNPQHFLRIHRGKILNTARLKKMRPLPGGDAMVELADGTELRASRTFSADLRDIFRSLRIAEISRD